MSNRLDQLESKVTHLTSQISETFSKIYLFHLTSIYLGWQLNIFLISVLLNNICFIQYARIVTMTVRYCNQKQRLILYSDIMLKVQANFFMVDILVCMFILNNHKSFFQDYKNCRKYFDEGNTRTGNYSCLFPMCMLWHSIRWTKLFNWRAFHDVC